MMLGGVWFRRLAVGALCCGLVGAVPLLSELPSGA